MTNEHAYIELDTPHIVSFQIVPLGYEWQINHILETGRAQPLFYAPDFISRFASVKEATEYLVKSGVLPDSIKVMTFGGDV
jgi:hypothetical protein